MRKQYHMYVMSNKINSVIYIGMTDDLERRLFEHKNKLINGFTKKYNLNKLIYFENYDDPRSAISREKQLKGWVRRKKFELIKLKNPQLEDLGEEILRLRSE